MNKNMRAYLFKRKLFYSSNTLNSFHSFKIYMSKNFRRIGFIIVKLPFLFLNILWYYQYSKPFSINNTWLFTLLWETAILFSILYSFFVSAAKRIQCCRVQTLMKILIISFTFDEFTFNRFINWFNLTLFLITKFYMLYHNNE